MTPETQNHETQPMQTAPERVQTPEQLQNQIFHEILRRYGVDIKDFIQECTSCSLDTLKIELENPEQLSLEQKVQAVYREYISQELQKERWVESTANLESITDSINSERILSLKEEFEKIISPVLEKYPFLDTQTQNFIKLWMVNAMLKSPLSEIADSLISGVGNFFGQLSQIDPNDVNSLASAFKSTPEDSGRSMAFEEKFTQILSSYTQKFDEIEKYFEDNWINDTQEQKNILSYVDWFWNPALIEAGVNWLDMTQLNPENKDTKNEAPLDTESLAEYIANSREKIVELSKKLELWDKTGDMIYSLINVWGSFWDSVQKITEMILKIPFLWKFFALLLWLNSDPNKAIEELRENTKNFKILSGFKWLWIWKDNKWNITNGVEPFTDIDLSEINFNASKKEIQSLKPFITSDKEEGIKNFWLWAFWNGIQKDGATLKFEMSSTQKQDKKITTQEFKEIIKIGLSDYNNQKEGQRIQTEETQRETQRSERESEVTGLQQEKQALQLLSGNTIEWLSNTGWIWDYNDFKKIRVSEIRETTNIEETLKKAIWEGWKVWIVSHVSDYDKLSPEVKNALKKAIEIVQEFLNTPEYAELFTTQSNIWNIIEHPRFQTFRENKIQNIQRKEQELRNQEEQLRFAQAIETTITWINTETRLSSEIDIWDKKIKFENQKLSIWTDTYSISGIDATLKDIVINGTDRVKFEWSRFGIPGSQEINRSTFIHGLQELVLKGRYEFASSDGKIIKIEKVV